MSGPGRSLYEESAVLFPEAPPAAADGGPWRDAARPRAAPPAARFERIEAPDDPSEADAAMNLLLGELEYEQGVDPAYAALCLGGPVPALEPGGRWNGILIVGKAPGAAEVAHGAPMTGKAGRLLDKILDRAGIERSEAYLTNVFRMQAPWSVDAEGRKCPNDVGAFFTDAPSLGNQRLPPLDGRHVLIGPDADVRELWRAVRRWKPSIVVGMGSVAAWALTGDPSLKDRLGEPMEDPRLRATVLLTYNTAYALHKRDEGTASLIADHMAVAAAHAAANPAPPPPAGEG